MTPQQKKAWKEILLITNEDFNPNWFEDTKMVQRHKELLEIIDPDSPGWKRVLTREELSQKQLDARNGLEEEIIKLVKDKIPQSRISRQLKIALFLITYVRKKHQLIHSCTQKEVPPKEELEEIYHSKRIDEIAKHYKISGDTFYIWLKKRGIPRNKPRGGRKNAKR